MKHLIRKYWLFIFLLSAFVIALVIALCIRHFQANGERNYFLVTFKNCNYPLPIVVHGNCKISDILQEVTNRTAKSFQEMVNKSTVTHQPWEIVNKDLQLTVIWEF